MSTPEKNEPKKHPTPGRTACAIATPESTSATCSESPAATDTGAVAPASRNGVIAIGWLASAQAHIASTMRKSQTSGLFGIDDADDRRLGLDRRAAAARDRGELDAVARPRARRAVGDVGHVRVADPRVVEVEMPARLGHVARLRRRRSARTPRSGVACVILTISTWSAYIPSRRPRSRSATNGEPPGGSMQSVPPPNVTARSGLRPCTVTCAGASFSCSITNSRSKRTRVPSTFWPSPASISSAGSCTTSAPISSRIVIACAWMASSASSERIVSGVSNTRPIIADWRVRRRRRRRRQRSSARLSSSPTDGMPTPRRRWRPRGSSERTTDAARGARRGARRDGARWRGSRAPAVRARRRGDGEHRRDPAALEAGRLRRRQQHPQVRAAVGRLGQRPRRRRRASTSRSRSTTTSATPTRGAKAVAQAITKDRLRP